MAPNKKLLLVISVPIPVNGTIRLCHAESDLGHSCTLICFSQVGECSNNSLPSWRGITCSNGRFHCGLRARWSPVWGHGPSMGLRGWSKEHERKSWRGASKHWAKDLAGGVKSSVHISVSVLLTTLAEIKAKFWISLVDFEPPIWAENLLVHALDCKSFIERFWLQFLHILGLQHGFSQNFYGSFIAETQYRIYAVLRSNLLYRISVTANCTFLCGGGVTVLGGTCWYLDPTGRFSCYSFFFLSTPLRLLYFSF